MKSDAEITSSQLAEAGFLPPTYLSVYVSGSVVKGWGNDKSDLDIYVITADAIELEAPHTATVGLQPPQIPTRADYLGDRRLDVEYWQEGQVDQLLSKLSWDALSIDGAAGEDLSHAEYVFLDRLGYAIPLADQMDANSWLTLRQKELSESAHRSILIAHHLTAADHRIEDSLGQLEAGDMQSAILSAHRAFRFTIDALLATYGRFSPNEKWRARQMSEVRPSEVDFDAYWERETFRSLDKDWQLWVTETLSLCQDIHSVISVA